MASLKLLKPTAEQRRAAEPGASVWVSANAGTGKTHVLVDRVIRLLLSGTRPERILCLTFTKAAAAEMANRLYDRLGSWATLPDETLHEAVGLLEGREVSAEDLARARRLFAQSLETPGGLKIQTIHAFCEHLLGRFPIEAGIPTHFEVLDERTAKELIFEARAELLDDIDRAREPCPSTSHRTSHADRDDSHLHDLLCAFDHLVSDLSLPDLDALAETAIAKRTRLAGLFERAGDRPLAGYVAAALSLPEDTLAPDGGDKLRRAGMNDNAMPLSALRAAVAVLGGGSKTDVQRAGAIAAVLSAGDRAACFDDYVSIFLTQKNEPRKSLATKKIADANPDLVESLFAEQDRIVRLVDDIKTAALARLTASVLTFARGLIGHYEALKQAGAYLDYDDLIIAVRDLLTRRSSAAWVLYKLDGGIEHVLVDEAQDTSPEQWEVIRALVEEFWAGAGAAPAGRTIFAVGDEKQSIYSFQGAEPERFDEMRRYFGRKVRAAERAWDPVELLLSYRSTSAVLATVDKVFAGGEAAEGLSAKLDGDGNPARVVHAVKRLGEAGRVELWPTIRPPEEPEPNAWDAPLDLATSQSPHVVLADRIAATIRRWLDEGEILAAKGRPVRPGDILILVQRRNEFVDEMIRQLKNRGVPVAGIDRMKLTEQLSVMDLTVLGDFLLLPEDDLALATVLKSPLIGFTEEDLFDLAHGRERSLWHALRERAGERESFGAAHALLAELLARADFEPPFEFFSRLLSADEGRIRAFARLGLDAIDPLDEFLNLALQYEDAHPPTLQGFLHWLKAGELQIKRDLEQGRNEVRVMTVHGAKGLEAPIVFLPDTCRLPTGRMLPSLLPAGDGLYLWPNSESRDASVAAAARERERAAQLAEYHRLLYVALTRATDRLYVCGYEGARARADGCWYDLFAGAFTAMPGVAEIPLDPVLWGGESGYRLDTPQEVEPEREAAPEAKPAIAAPGWLHEPAAPERAREAPQAPSALAAVLGLGGEPPVLSPLAGDDLSRFKRGTLIHRLLQSLPELAPEARAAAAARFLAEPGHDLTEAQQREIAAETLRVMETPEFAHLFAPGSRAEVPVIGTVPQWGVKVAGQVDRLIVTAAEVVILDYKTNRPPPETAAEVAPAYLVQMAAYRAVLQGLYPGRPVRCALLWTDVPRLMALPDAALDHVLNITPPGASS